MIIFLIIFLLAKGTSPFRATNPIHAPTIIVLSCDQPTTPQRPPRWRGPLWCTRLDFGSAKAASAGKNLVLLPSSYAFLLARTNVNRPFVRPTYYTTTTPSLEGAVVVYPIGFEPTAPSVGGLCSIQLSYGYVLTTLFYYFSSLFCKRFYAPFPIFLKYFSPTPFLFDFLRKLCYTILKYTAFRGVLWQKRWSSA